MSDTLKLYPPPKGGRWETDSEDFRISNFIRVALIVRAPGLFGSEHEVGHDLVSTRGTNLELECKRIKAANEGDYLTATCIDSTRPLTEDEIDRAIWEASREIVRKYNRKRRPHEYVTEWEDA